MTNIFQMSGEKPPTINGKLVVWFPGIPPKMKGIGILRGQEVESQTTWPQTTNLPLVENHQLGNLTLILTTDGRDAKLGSEVKMIR